MEVIFRTFERQREALRCLRDKQTNEVLYGGGARGGKSWLGCGWVITECLSKPGSSWLIAREELTKLRDTTLLTFFKVAKEFVITEYFSFNAQSNTATFVNGSIVFFREIKYIPSDPEFDRLGSYDLTGCFIDEAQQIHAKAISVLKGRFSVLYGEGWSTIPKSLYTCNPARNWIYTDFVKPQKENKLRKDRAFIKSLAQDNPTVSQDYIENLKKADKITQERLLYGNFEYDDDPATLIDADSIADYFNPVHIKRVGEKYLTIDVAREGDDKTVFRVWHGWLCIYREEMAKSSVPEVVNKAKQLQRIYSIPASNIVADEGGVGGGVVDYLKCKGFISQAVPLEVKQGDIYVKPNYDSLKSQCSIKMAEMICNRMAGEICNNSSVIEQTSEEMAQVKLKDVDTEGKVGVTSKKVVKEKLSRSPDDWDSIMMRYFFALQKTRTSKAYF